MKIKSTLTAGGLICLVFFLCLAHLALYDEVLPFSIFAVQTFMNHWLKHWHILAVAIIPIYVALIFFLAIVCGNVLGSAIQYWIYRFLKKK